MACCGRLSLNILTYVVLSLARQPSSIERLQADLFVPNALAPIAPTFRRWRTTVTVQDIQSTVAQYLGPDRARHSFEAFAATRNARLDPAAPADFELLQHAEHLIASSIGAASSRLVMSLLLRKRTVSAKAALKLLDDSHAALHFNREILQTALNHVRQGIAVFDADLQLICSNRQFGEILGLPPHLVQIGIPLQEILEFMGVINPPGFGEADSGALLERRLAAYTTEGEPYLERLPDRHMVIEVRSNRMPGGGLVITFSDVTPSLRGRRSAGARQCHAGKARARPHRGTDAAEFGTGAGQEHRRGRQHLQDALSGRCQPRHPAAAERGAALCHEPGRAPDRRRGFAAGREHRRFAGGDRGNPRRAAGYFAARRRRHDAVDHELQDERPDALAGNRIRADRARQGAEADLRALLAAGGIRSPAAAAAAAEPDFQRHQIHPARPRAGRLPPPRTKPADRRLRHRRRHSRRSSAARSSRSFTGSSRARGSRAALGWGCRSSNAWRASSITASRSMPTAAAARYFR